MPSTLESTTIEKPRSSAKARAKKIGALLSATTALSGLAAPAAFAKQTPAKAAAHETVRSTPREPQELPGLKIHLGQETLNKIKDSTLELGLRTKGDTNSVYMPNCTAVKVLIPGHKEPYIMTAAHCFGNITGVPYGVFSDSLHPSYKAEEFSAVSPLEYVVLDPQTGYETRVATPLAAIDKISIDTNNRDVALLHPVIPPAAQKGPLLVRSFENIPAIPLKIAEKAPIQGTPVALYGEPQANGFEPIATTGVYLGRVSYSTDPVIGSGPNIPGTVRQMDLVGINPSTPEEDNCNYGTSGSMALLPNGQLLGNLTLRTNSGYGPEKFMQPPDNIDFDKYYRDIWAQQLNVNLDGFTTICGYTVMDSQTPKDLITGFGHPVSGKGADPTSIH